ncbi:MAG: hypothetical protein QOF90_1473 [Acetobacteraceae bacterium]|nr:hypothetical protein [Acetobacteraceae bacterium]
MSTVTNIRAAAPALPEVVGYVEAATADRILGWAWAPATPELHAAIEIRIGDTVVANTVADLPRVDLASSGIGDGRHAYDITIPAEFRARAAELRVFARAGDGVAVPIGATPTADGLSDQVTKLLRGVDLLVNSQRLIHRNLQAALTVKPAATDTDAESTSVVLARMAEVQAAVVEQISGVERFVMRLDEQLSRLSPAAAQSTAAIPRLAVWALGVAGTALVVSVFGLVRSLSGYGE